jgi:hypothetical protein
MAPSASEKGDNAAQAPPEESISGASGSAPAAVTIVTIAPIPTRNASRNKKFEGVAKKFLGHSCK